MLSNYPTSIVSPHVGREGKSGSEILTRTAIISEQIEETRIRKKKFTIPMSDEPGSYELDELSNLLTEYLAQDLLTARRIRDLLLPACLEHGRISREELKEKFVESGTLDDPGTVGHALSHVSTQVGMVKNDFIRQVLGYE